MSYSFVIGAKKLEYTNVLYIAILYDDSSEENITFLTHHLKEIS